MRAVAYARVSTDRDDQKNSLETQKILFEEHCEKVGYQKGNSGVLWRRNGHHELVQGIYADEGISGTSLKNREAFRRMISDAEAGKFDVIFTKSISRFGRNAVDVLENIKLLKALNIAVYFHDMRFNTLIDSHREFELTLFAGLAQEESRHKSDITKIGIRRAQREGKWIPNPPFGYDKDEGYLKINESEAEVVRTIYNLYYRHSYGTTRIARYLNDKNILSKKGTNWTQTQVAKILDNPVYIGKQTTHTVENIDINIGLRREIPEEDRFVFVKPELQIVESDIFELVQIERDRRKRLKNNTDEPAQRHSNKHLLSNILVCGNCGSSLKRKKRHAFRRKDGTSKELGFEWCCNQNDRYGSHVCDVRNAVVEDEIIEYVTTEILKYRTNSSELEWNLNQFIDTYFGDTASEQTLEDIEKGIQRIKKLRDKNFEAYADEIIGQQEYRARNQELALSLSELESTKNNILFRDKEIEAVKLRYREYCEFLQSLDPTNLTNAILRKLIKVIVVYTFTEPFPDTPKGTKSIQIQWDFLGVTQDELIEDMVIQAGHFTLDENIDYDNDEDIVFDPRDFHQAHNQRLHRVRNQMKQPTYNK